MSLDRSLAPMEAFGVLFSFLILLREGFEVALIIALVLGYLRQTGNRRHFREVWLGASAAGALCLITGGGLELAATSLATSAREAFEGFTMLFAVAVLTWMVFWMRRQAASLGRDLRQHVEVALESGSLTALVLLAFSAVLREGLETTLLLFAGASAQRGASTLPFLLGAAGGLAVSGALGYIVYRGSRILPLRQFFTVTGVVVLILAAGLLSNGLGELHESGLVSNLGSRPWDTDSFISTTTASGKLLHTLLGYDSAPTFGQIALYWSYLVLGLSAFGLGVGSRPRGAERQVAA